MDRFAERLVDFRKRTGKTQEDIATLTSRSPRTVRNWERGNTQPSSEDFLILQPLMLEEEQGDNGNHDPFQWMEEAFLQELDGLDKPGLVVTGAKAVENLLRQQRASFDEARPAVRKLVGLLSAQRRYDSALGFLKALEQADLDPKDEFLLRLLRLVVRRQRAPQKSGELVRSFVDLGNDVYQFGSSRTKAVHAEFACEYVRTLFNSILDQPEPCAHIQPVPLALEHLAAAAKYADADVYGVRKWLVHDTLPLAGVLAELADVSPTLKREALGAFSLVGPSNPHEQAMNAQTEVTVFASRSVIYADKSSARDAVDVAAQHLQNPAVARSPHTVARIGFNLARAGRLL